MPAGAIAVTVVGCVAFTVGAAIMIYCFIKRRHVYMRSGIVSAFKIFPRHIIFSEIYVSTLGISLPLTNFDLKRKVTATI